MKNIGKFLILSVVLLGISSFRGLAVENNQQPANSANVSIHKEIKSDHPGSLMKESKKLSFKEKIQLSRKFKKEIREYRKTNSDVPMVVLYILAILLPPLAVGLFTNWGEPTLWNLLFTILMWLPGVIHAFYILLK